MKPNGEGKSKEQIQDTGWLLYNSLALYNNSGNHVQDATLVPNQAKNIVAKGEDFPPFKMEQLQVITTLRDLAGKSAKVSQTVTNLNNTNCFQCDWDAIQRVFSENLSLPDHGKVGVTWKNTVGDTKWDNMIVCSGLVQIKLYVQKMSDK